MPKKHEEFDRFQKMVLQSYNDGDHMVVKPSDVKKCGDTLLRYLLADLSEATGCDSVETATQRLRNAMAQLRAVFAAVDASAVGSTMKPFSVIGVVEDTGQIVCHHVMAQTDLNSFSVAAAKDKRLELVVALPGHLNEDQDLVFPGEGVVSSMTVLEQSHVFGTGE